MLLLNYLTGCVIMKIADDALERAKRIKIVVFDVDGTLTDGSLLVGPQGELFKPFHCRDGMGFTLARECGLKTAFITGRKSDILSFRAKELKIDGVWQGVKHKLLAYGELKDRFCVSDDEVAYLGDDLNDLPMLSTVSLPCAVADAATEVRDIALLVTDKPGGKGAARDVFEFIIKAQGKWEQAVSMFDGKG